jgi:hypothetical protein
VNEISPLGRWVERARFLSEIAQAGTLKALSHEEQSQWRQILDPANEGLFDSRRGQLQSTIAQPSFLSDVDPAKEPAEILTTFEVLGRALASDPSALSGCAHLPFEVVWRPIVAFARFQALPAETHLLAKGAMDELCRHLLDEISHMAAPAVYLLFDKARGNGVSYADFIKQLTEDRLGFLFDRFPALARAVGNLLQQWISAVRLFRERLGHDLDQIEATVTGPLGRAPRVVQITYGLSERHSGGLQ